MLKLGVPDKNSVNICGMNERMIELQRFVDPWY